MKMKILRKKKSGVTLIELIAAMTVLIVAILGAMMYRYGSVVDARMADIHMCAGRVALLVMEEWKGAAGSYTFDPSDDIALNSALAGGSDNITISAKSGDYWPVSLTGGTVSYYYVKIDWEDDIDGDSNNDDGIRRLDVHVAWKLHAVSGVPDSADWARAVKLSSYVRAY
jgi:type II secretory pathway pseudopilin PulG